MTCNVLVKWAQSMGVAMMANKKTLFVTFMDRDNAKHIQASLSLIPTDWLRLLVAQMPRSRDLAIFMVITDGQMDRRTDGQTDRLLYPCACTRGNKPQN